MSTSEGQQVGRFGENTRWFGHVRRKDDVYIGKRMLRMDASKEGKKRGRPKGGLWMRYESTWQRWRRTKMGTKSAVTTPDGRSRKKKSEIFEI